MCVSTRSYRSFWLVGFTDNWVMYCLPSQNKLICLVCGATHRCAANAPGSEGAGRVNKQQWPFTVQAELLFDGCWETGWPTASQLLWVWSSNLQRPEQVCVSSVRSGLNWMWLKVQSSHSREIPGKVMKLQKLFSRLGKCLEHEQNVLDQF